MPCCGSMACPSIGRAGRFRAAGRWSRLSSLDFDLLAALAGAPGRVFSRPNCSNGCGGTTSTATSGWSTCTSGALRSRLGDPVTDPHLIATVRGVGTSSSVAPDDDANAGAVVVVLRPGCHRRGRCRVPDGVAARSRPVRSPGRHDGREGHGTGAGSSTGLHDAFAPPSRPPWRSGSRQRGGSGGCRLVRHRPADAPVARGSVGYPADRGREYQVSVPVPTEPELAALANDVNTLGSALADTEARRTRLLGDVAPNCALR